MRGTRQRCFDGTNSKPRKVLENAHAVLKDGSRYRAREKWTISNGRALITLETGEVMQIEPSLIDKFVTELHNPEVTLPANGGDVAERNYRMLGAVLTKAGKMGKAEIGRFVKEKGLPGFAPTQRRVPAMTSAPTMPPPTTSGDLGHRRSGGSRLPRSQTPQAL